MLSHYLTINLFILKYPKYIYSVSNIVARCFIHCLLQLFAGIWKLIYFCYFYINFQYTDLPNTIVKVDIYSSNILKTIVTLLFALKALFVQIKQIYEYATPCEERSTECYCFLFFTCFLCTDLDRLL